MITITFTNLCNTLRPTDNWSFHIYCPRFRTKPCTQSSATVSQKGLLHQKQQHWNENSTTARVPVNFGKSLPCEIYLVAEWLPLAHGWCKYIAFEPIFLFHRCRVVFLSHLRNKDSVAVLTSLGSRYRFFLNFFLRPDDSSVSESSFRPPLPFFFFSSLSLISYERGNFSPR